MRLRFSDWLDNQEIEDEAKDLFSESVKCYKASAYRAALLFSFLGFQTVIKHRMLLSKTPEKYEDQEWSNIQIQLQNDETWEKHVIESIKAKKKPVFKVSNDLYEQYFYWKNRRNDCAHAKGNAIDYPHVESFWLFIESNLSKFVVNGGKAHVIEQIINYLNPSITPSGTDVGPIIKQVPFAIELIEYKGFLEELLKITYGSKKRFAFMDTPEILVWSELFTLPEERNRILIDFLKDNRRFTYFLLREKPNLIQHFHKEPGYVRSLWKEDFAIAVDYKIFIMMIQNNLIPKEQLDELFLHMFNNIPSDIFGEDQFLKEEFPKMYLKDKGFFDSFYKHAFKEREIKHDFNWGNRNKDLVLYYLDNFELDDTIVKALNSALNSVYSPRHLKEVLIGFYKTNKKIWDNYKSICDDLGETTPDCLAQISFESE
ncbi:hypothetical protein CN894_18045 [Bacillus thuringiensis]|uniref:hypothetical protein n=1 Tax=Bacillus thuringiensis TaxID=1428 RepID=UPI000BFDE53F|nr:hypothetical protein [Bacillus thuringiensis]PGH71505.1 hypothetical protein CN894_18045 [Bacillus thuringiensis]